MSETAAPMIKEGLPYPLGATWDGNGTNFALFSANATKVEVCLFDEHRKTRDRADRAAGIHRPDFSRLPSRMSGPARSTAIASMDPTSRRMGTASIRTSCCSIPMPGRMPAS